jgi:hypothetical protein
MMTVNATKESEAGVPPSPELMARMGKLIEEMTRSGVLISTGGLLPSSKGARIKCSGGRVTVTDGPFTEAKELIAGFAIVEAQSKEHAIELSRRFWEVHGDGEGQIRQMDR